MTLVRWNTPRNLVNEFDRMFNNPSVRWEMPQSWGLPLDVSENEDAYTVKASMPGIPSDDINVTLEDNVLTIKGEIAGDNEVEGEQYHIRERRYGSFGRSLRFPVDVNTDAIEAVYENGVLTLTVPKAEEVKPKQISVKVNSN